MTFRELLTMQRKHKAMIDNIVFQKEKLRSLDYGTTAYVRQFQYIKDLDADLEEFLDTEI
ncbi:hypothetical protein AU106_gp020 [Sinorhizobium phage phiM9]|uniref:Uncharacterized protein n=1 Tax=Sinorhizobium phage phiM9 TaxID=1636182 RepID=A0A0F6TGN3_9CAUD|nr:hypothetical protein AU106_gp020 [Sinorhizobium phage phiM9]AKE44651.1 hypothetical protein Sm_phiM9_021 [Sinorhizobium phage phiM9]